MFCAPGCPQVFATQGALQTFTDCRSMLASVRRVQAVLSDVPPDPSMTAALPPGAWWDVANQLNGSLPVGEESSHEIGYSRAAAGMAAASEGSSSALGSAVMAARRGDLELRNVTFAYPARPGVPVLKQLSLTLPRGKVTAVVGR